MLLKGLTVEEAIAKLQTLDPKAILVTESEWGASPVGRIEEGVAYKYTQDTRGTTGWLWTNQNVDKYCQQPAVLVM